MTGNEPQDRTTVDERVALINAMSPAERDKFLTFLTGYLLNEFDDAMSGWRNSRPQDLHEGGRVMTGPERGGLPGQPDDETAAAPSGEAS